MYPKGIILTLGELGSATSGLETVLLPLLHSGVTGQIAGLLEGAAELGVCNEKGAGDAVTDCTGLTGGAAAVNVNLNVELAQGVGASSAFMSPMLLITVATTVSPRSFPSR